MSVQDQNFLGSYFIWSFVGWVILPSALVILIMDALLRRERWMVRRAARDAGLEPPFHLEMPSLEQDARRDSKWLWSQFFSRIGHGLVYALLLNNMLGRPQWNAFDAVIMVGLLSPMVIGVLFSFRRCDKSRWLRLAEALAAVGIIVWLQFHKEVLHVLVASLALFMLILVTVSVVKHYAREWSVPPEYAGLPRNAMVMKRSFLLARISLLVLLLVWLGWYFWAGVWQMLPPVAKQGFWK